jgi:hypothetical protein
MTTILSIRRGMLMHRQDLAGEALWLLGCLAVAAVLVTGSAASWSAAERPAEPWSALARSTFAIGGGLYLAAATSRLARGALRRVQVRRSSGAHEP